MVATGFQLFTSVLSFLNDTRMKTTGTHDAGRRHMIVINCK